MVLSVLVTPFEMLDRRQTELLFLKDASRQFIGTVC